MAFKGSSPAAGVRQQRGVEFGRRSASAASLCAESACGLSDPASRARLTALSAMASAMAHELSQPLTASTNYLQTSAHALRMTIKALEEMIATIEAASSQTMRAAELVRRMRAFVVAGRVEGRPEDLRAMVVNACAGVRELAEVELVTEFDTAASHVMCDRIQIETVLANLLRNAAQALAGRVAGKIRLSTESAEGTVFVRIEDNGPGIADAHLDHLFEPLFTTRAEGSGLGLSICATIVEAHGGAMWVEKPASGSGAVFLVALPRADVI